MKNRSLLNRIISIVLLTGISFTSHSQVLAQWNFNNLLSGIGSSNMFTTPAVLGPAIPVGDYNGGTVFFGEGGWPTGGLDPNAYLEFTVKPAAAYSLTVASLQMNIRRSTTGANAGPNNWSLRSSLDNYTNDVASGVLTNNAAAAIPVVLGASFARLSVPVSFRLYGYNVTMTAGGLNRFVFDNISIGGAAILPVTLGSFNASAKASTVNLDWTTPDNSELSKVLVQRAGADSVFTTLSVMSGQQISWHYSDENVADGNYSYRIALKSVDNSISYSSVKLISVSLQTALSVEGISSGSGAMRVRINCPVSGAYRLTLYNMNGYPVSTKNAQLYAGTQNVDLASNAPARGIYIVRAESGSQSSTGRIMIP